MMKMKTKIVSDFQVKNQYLNPIPVITGILRTFLDDLYDNIARNQEKENRRKKRTQTIDQYEEHTYTGPSSALIVFGKFFFISLIHDSMFFRIIAVTFKRLNRRPMVGYCWNDRPMDFKKDPEQSIYR